MAEFERIARGEERTAEGASQDAPAVFDRAFLERLTRARFREQREVNLRAHASIGLATASDDNDRRLTTDAYVQAMREVHRLARKSLLEGGSPKAWRLSARTLLRDAGIDPEAHPELLDQAARAHGEALAELAFQLAFEAEGEHGRVGNVPMFGPEAYAKDERGPQVTLAAASQRFLANPLKQIAASTLQQYRPRMAVLVEAVGADRPVADITASECRRYVEEVVVKLPANQAKKYPGVPLRDAIERGARDGAPVISIKTQRLYVELLRTFFSWAEQEELVAASPARRVPLPKGREGERTDFSVEQLQAIFNAPIFTGCQDDEAGFAKPGSARPRRGRFWVPLIALYSGMRLNEIVQLQARDVRKGWGNVPMFDLREDAEAGRLLKTRGSARQVPVHPTLIELGLLDYAQGLRADGPLFPDLIARAADPGDAFSKWFGRLLGTVGITDRRLTFHSLRHTFATGCRASGIPKDIKDAIGGWVDGSAAEGYGRHPLPALAKALEKLEYVGLELRRLRPAG